MEPASSSDESKDDLLNNEFNIGLESSNLQNTLSYETVSMKSLDFDKSKNLYHKIDSYNLKLESRNNLLKLKNIGIRQKKEIDLARILKKKCSEEKIEKNLENSPSIFHQMSHLYRQRSPDKFSLIRSAALLNAALYRSSICSTTCVDFKFDEAEQDLKDLCQHVLDLAGAKYKADLVDFAKCLTESIENMREKAKKSLQNIEKIPLNLVSSKLHKCELDKIEKIKQIQESVTEDYTSIMATISNKCETIMGEPPCEYALVGMGSLARKEITPYSDFEHVIVLEDKCNQCNKNYEKILDYFRWYSVVFHIIVINLQETILPSVAISTLNGKYSELGNWFFDAHTKRGISFDGMMPHACKFLLGRQKKTKKKISQSSLFNRYKKC